MKPHGYVVYLPPELYVAVVKLQADRRLGRVYPVLYSINEGLFKLGYIEKEVYEKYAERYSTPLIVEEPPTFEELVKREELKKMEKHFSDVLRQWPKLNEKARQFHVAKASECVDRVTNARLVLDLINDSVGSARE